MEYASGLFYNPNVALPKLRALLFLNYSNTQGVLVIYMIMIMSLCTPFKTTVLLSYSINIFLICIASVTTPRTLSGKCGGCSALFPDAISSLLLHSLALLYYK